MTPSEIIKRQIAVLKDEIPSYADIRAPRLKIAMNNLEAVADQITEWEKHAVVNQPELNVIPFPRSKRTVSSNPNDGDAA